MLVIFESSLPIFLLILAGLLIKRLPSMDARTWPGLENLCYWFLYPALLFATVMRADFSAIEMGHLLVALLVSIAAMTACALLVWPAFGERWIARTEFSSVFQTSIRWNGFMALAIAERLYGTAGAAAMALAMAVIIVPVNVASVTVGARFDSAGSDIRSVLLRIARNPFIIAIGMGLVSRLLPGGLYAPLDVTLDMLANAALGMGLLVVGTGLRPADMWQGSLSVWLPVVFKLLFFPMSAIAIALAFGLGTQETAYLVLCASVPTATNGYVLARQMGGDAELYAAVVTLQTVLSFITIPLMLSIAGYAASA